MCIRDRSHINLSRRAHVLLIAPASANLIAKMAHGLADDLATTTLLASNKKIFLARDKFGEKPLFYYFSEKIGFLFSSEIKSEVKNVEICTESVNSDNKSRRVSFINIEMIKKVDVEVSQEATEEKPTEE